jgi:hypothetical protein
MTGHLDALAGELGILVADFNADANRIEVSEENWQPRTFINTHQKSSRNGRKYIFIL